MNHSDPNRNAYMLCGSLAKRGYLRWWHSFRGVSRETGTARSFFVEYLILNPVPGKPRKGHKPAPSYVRVTAGSYPVEDPSLPGIRLCSYYPISAARYARKPLFFQVEENRLSEYRISGFVDVTAQEVRKSQSSEAGVMEWDLEMNKSLSCHTGIIASPLFCALNALDSFFHGEGIRTEYRGSVVLNGENFDVTPEESFGYADKHWGSNYNRPWLQLSSCCLYSQRFGRLLKNSALAVDGCCPRFLFFHLKPRLMLQLTYRGEDFCFSFARPFTLSRLKWCTRENRKRFSWQVKAQNINSVVKLSMECPKDAMLFLNYDNPGDAPAGTGKTRPPLWSGGEGLGAIDLYRITADGREWVDTLTIRHALCEFQRADSKSAPSEKQR